MICKPSARIISFPASASWDDIITRAHRLIFVIVFFALLLKLVADAMCLHGNQPAPQKGTVSGELALPHAPCSAESDSDSFSCAKLTASSLRRRRLTYLRPVQFRFDFLPT